jgi:hypothetical protein
MSRDPCSQARPFRAEWLTSHIWENLEYENEVEHRKTIFVDEEYQ